MISGITQLGEERCAFNGFRSPNHLVEAVYRHVIYDIVTSADVTPIVIA